MSCTASGGSCRSASGWPSAAVQPCTAAGSVLPLLQVCGHVADFCLSSGPCLGCWASEAWKRVRICTIYVYIHTYVCTIHTVCDNIMLTVHDLTICNGTLTLYCHIRTYVPYANHGSQSHCQVRH